MDEKNDSRKSEMESPRGDNPSILKRSLHKIITEEEFEEPFKKHAIPFFKLAGIIIEDTGKFSPRFYYNLVSEAEKFETFLDDYGARENSRWHYFCKIIASIRNFAVAAFELSHVLNRHEEYFSNEGDDDTPEFLTHGMEVLEYINRISKSLLEEGHTELLRNGTELGKFDISLYSFGEIGQKEKLPRDLKMDSLKTSDAWIMRIAEEYRKIALKMQVDKYGNKPEPDELAKIIPAGFNETKVKVLENALHNIQSEYDTHLRQTYLEKQHPDLPKLRSAISATMHLLEMARWIIHFYERHENETDDSENENRISLIVDKNMVLQLLSKFAFYYAHKHITDGKPIAEAIMSRFANKGTIELSVPKPAGFHARPAYYITLVVEQHGTDTFLVIDDRKFDARSVLDLLEAGGLAADKEMETVIFEGDERTLADLQILADNNYCEDEKIPKELNYIRVARNIMT